MLVQRNMFAFANIVKNVEMVANDGSICMSAMYFNSKATVMLSKQRVCYIASNLSTKAYIPGHVQTMNKPCQGRCIHNRFIVKV